MSYPWPRTGSTASSSRNTLQQTAPHPAMHNALPPTDRTPLVEVLHPTALAFEQEGYDLRDDADRLDRGRSAGAHEAVVFYGARVLEVMARHLPSASRHPTDRVVDNINYLYDYG